MKLKTEIIALCDYAIISREGKLSINGIFDELRITKFPGGIARAFLVATVHGLPEKSYGLVLKVEGENKDVKNPLNQLNINIHTSPNGKNNVVIELVNIAFEKGGDYRFVIYCDDEEVGSTLLKVIHVKQKESFKIPN